MRVQLALNVRDLDEAIAFYGSMFGARPHKRRPGYANFALDTPPLKLVLLENPSASERLNHLGVELFDAAELADAGDRLHAAGLVDAIEKQTRCCHAVQDKFWAAEPQGLRWEWYRITDDDPATDTMPSSLCCGGEENAGICCA